ncbi:MAG: hypothetical protein ABI595_04550 [Actinomycetota bacterium]
MNRATRLLAALITTGLIAVASGRVTFAAFTATTASPANAIASGTVSIADNDAGNVMWNVTNQLPTSPAIVRCIRVTYTGTLPATVRLYTTTAASALDPYLNVTVEKGTMPAATTFSNCTGFTSQATIAPTGTLQAFKTARTGWANGLQAFPGAQTAWNASDTLVYRFTVQVQTVFAAQGLTGLVGFTWEAQNQ